MKQYSRSGRTVLLDRVRKLLVPDIPEERVRQECVNRLIDHQGFPETKIDTEYSLAHIARDKRRRADIVVWEQMDKKALVLVETKAPDVHLDQTVLDQAMSYQKVLRAEYVVITNGTQTLSYRIEGSRHIRIGNDFKYADMQSHYPSTNEAEEEIGRLSYSEVT